MATAKADIKVEIVLKLSPKEAGYIWGITQNPRPLAGDYKESIVEEGCRKAIWETLNECKRTWENR